MAKTQLQNIVILGAGVWGRAFGKALCDTANIIFWDQDNIKAQQVANQLGCQSYLSFDEAIEQSMLVILAISSQGFSEVMGRLQGHPQKLVAWLTKGFDIQTNRPLSHTAAQILGKRGRFAAISGPSFAHEVEQFLPTALEVSANMPEDAKILQTTLHRRHLRIYINDDIVATCVGGAVKNIIAIATGISDAMQLGNNARAALIARGMQEMSYICNALGGRHENLLGLVGVGDLVLTCTSELSRNYCLGKAIGKNAHIIVSTEQIKKLQQQTCEGVKSAQTVWQCGEDYNLNLPIIAMVNCILNGEISPKDALEKILSRLMPVK